MRAHAWPFPPLTRWVCHWRWGCTPAGEKGSGTPRPAPRQWSAALRDTNIHSYKLHTLNIPANKLHSIKKNDIYQNYKLSVNKPVNWQKTSWDLWTAKERLTSISMGLVEQLCARVEVSEGSDAQAVGGMKLRLQEFTANLTDIHQLEEAGCRQQHLRGNRSQRVAGWASRLPAQSLPV